MQKPKKWSNNRRGLWRSSRSSVAPAIFVAAAFACSACFAGEYTGNLDGEYGEISKNTLDLTKQIQTSALEHLLPTLYTVKMTARAGVRYDSNINIAPEGEADLIYTFEPTIHIGFGDVSRDLPQIGWDAPNTPVRSKARLLLSYTAMLGAFQKNDDQNYFDYNASVRGGMILGKTRLDASVRFQRLSTPDLDLGRRVERNVISGVVGANYRLSEKSSLVTNVSADTKDYQDQGSDSNSVELISLYDYRVSQKTTLGAGFGAGRINSDDGITQSEQTYGQGLLHASWQPDKKLSAQIRGGLDFRHISPSGENKVNPTLSASATYRPERNTRISLSAVQQTTSSADSASQSVNRTRIDLTLSQILFQRLTVSATGSWQRSSYQSTTSGSDSDQAGDQTEDYMSTSLNMSYKFAQDWAIEASFNYNWNTAVDPSREFDQTLAEIRVVFEL
ncbi:MAG TPA: outer membrane beta-barrel protein [Chthoniobacterales bacterium]